MNYLLSCCCLLITMWSRLVLQHLQPQTATLDMSAPMAAVWALAGASPCLSQTFTHIFTQCWAFISSLAEKKIVSFCAMTEFPYILPLGLYPSQDFDITEKKRKTKTLQHLHVCLCVISSLCILNYWKIIVPNLDPVQGDLLQPSP